MATHSYFVVKKLYVLALKHKAHIPVLMAGKDGKWQQTSLIDGMPDNDIINESIRLFEEEMDGSAL